MGGSGGDIGKQVSEQHRRLEALFRSTRTAFDRGTASEALGELRDALEAHLAQEDCLYYPAIWTLRPEHRDRLQAFVSAHDAFRGRLDAIADQLARGEDAGARAGFERFVETFGQHEAGEEAFLGLLDRDLAAPR